MQPFLEDQGREWVRKEGEREKTGTLY